MFQTRVKTGAVYFAVMCLMLYFSHIPWVLNGAVMFLSVYALGELGNALGIRQKGWLMTAGLAAALLVVLLPAGAYNALLAVLFPAMLLMFGVLMHRIAAVRCLHRWQKGLICGAVVVFFSAMKFIRIREDGLFLLTLGILVCMATDSFAYLVGKTWGRHKLAPRVSPGKTLEGSIGGTAVTVAGLLAVCVLLDHLGLVQPYYGKLTLYLVTASLVGQYGALCMSAIKRVVGIKDYGSLLPGHGGILDRFDSQLFVLPYTCLFCSILGGLVL